MGFVTKEKKKPNPLWKVENKNTSSLKGNESNKFSESKFKLRDQKQEFCLAELFGFRNL